MFDKTYESADEAVSVIESGATILVSGFGDIGLPFELLHALARTRVRDLTIVSNNAGTGELGLSRLFKNRQVSRLIASFPSQPDSHHYFAAHEAGAVEVELVPQGTLAERIRAGGAGLAGFFTPTGYGTELAEGKECRIIDGRGYVFERPLRGDFALIKADLADPYGNLRYRLASRNFNPIMAMAARTTIAEVKKKVPVGGIGPDDIHTPGVYVDRMVEVGND
ncbi:MULTISPECIES: 3-oxoacid CoA-transferase subunit A [unclassified Achromobacter]|jgi:3-oxoadipate CoA-transferase alpha subunit|uniref:3-oxoacid CoA-transferase subunit A n=1 Tax=unclassified Achromobacter TaxID=2626865 RepID=UPI00069FA6FB|nr:MULTISPECIES: 3-oxoacid CoA-transferase subunit A [unclassified Achromobacter]KOF54446.1 3-oxoadipate CoA-transferase [Achromobacter sp. DMS1]KOF55397.1 3-oxoadipate CoA-transferase [Achromobacter sp. DMS1]